MEKIYTALGLMSGTSMDGVDASIIKSDGHSEFNNIFDEYYEFDEKLQQRLVDLRKNRMTSLKETQNKNYTDIDNIQKEIDGAKKTFKKYGWPSIDITRKSVEETAASIIKIYEIYNQKQ